MVLLCNTAISDTCKFLFRCIIHLSITSSDIFLSQSSGELFFIFHLNAGKISLVIAPLVSIEQQFRKVCQAWGIKHLSLDELDEADILTEASSVKPVVITSTITRVAEEGVQKVLRGLPIGVICVDEAQVGADGA